MRNKIEYSGHTFTASDIKSVNIRLASSLISRQLEANSITAVVETDNESIQHFVRNTPMRYYYRYQQRFLSYVQSIDRVGPRAYQIYGTSAIGLLMERGHTGGIYTGQTAESVIREIVGNIPFAMKLSLKGVKLYGWLPYAKPPDRSARDNLVQVLFAIGAALKTDLDGVLRIQALWDGISGTIEWGQIYEDGAKAQRSGAVSSVSVTEHNYIAGDETTNLFEGTAISGDVITFSEPMHSLTATGFSILASGANWAKLSAGTGILTGKKYIHNTRQITRTVTQGAPENIETIDDATLVSFFNSNSVADSMAEYYKHVETIDCDVILDQQSPGDVLNIYHPYTKQPVPACVETLDISASSILKGSMKAVVGYRPPQISEIEYFDKRQLFTSSTTFKVPNGVHNIRAVLIGGGQGGGGGANGSAGGKGGTAQLSGPSGTSSGTKGTPGNGGAAGAGGAGGKVRIVDISVEPGQIINISIGSGGSGGSAGSSGRAGGDTVITISGRSYSSGSGSSTASGYTDPQTGEVFARPGSSGTSGGRGGEAGSGYNVAGSSGSSAGVNKGGIGNSKSSYVRDYVNGGWSGVTESYNYTFVELYLCCCGGGGAAFGRSGGNAAGNYDGNPPNSGGNGANASGAGSASVTLGGGGGGGNGGGGGGGGGGGLVMMTITAGKGSSLSASQTGADGGAGGSGSSGTSGKSGGVIFYYAEAKEAAAGSPLDKNNKLFLDRFSRILVT